MNDVSLIHTRRFLLFLWYRDDSSIRHWGVMFVERGKMWCAALGLGSLGFGYPALSCLSRVPVPAWAIQPGLFRAWVWMEAVGPGALWHLGHPNGTCALSEELPPPSWNWTAAQMSAVNSGQHPPSLLRDSHGFFPFCFIWKGLQKCQVLLVRCTPLHTLHWCVVLVGLEQAPRQQHRGTESTVQKKNLIWRPLFC